MAISGDSARVGASEWFCTTARVASEQDVVVSKKGVMLMLMVGVDGVGRVVDIPSKSRATERRETGEATCPVLVILTLFIRLLR